MRLIFLSIIIPVVFSFNNDFSFSDDQQQGSDSLNVRSSARQVTGDEIPLEPPSGQRCSGRNFQGRRCCTPENPCGLGEGDCDGPLDGGLNDGHEGCKGELVCGSNNCRKFGKYFHPKDDCCDEPSTLATERPPPVIVPGVPLEPPAGQRCTGRNFSPGRRCCTPENPCDEGEGDCDGALDGGLNDGDKGCKGSLVCGSNNCKKFGSYYHEKDDCCEKPASSCSTESGNYAAAPCIFPFTYNGVVRNQCIWDDAYNKHNQAWCATEVDAAGGYVSSKWGNCGPGCPADDNTQAETVSRAEIQWGQWSLFGPCSVQCNGGQTTRNRQCTGECRHLSQSQWRSCNLNKCLGRSAAQDQSRWREMILQ